MSFLWEEPPVTAMPRGKKEKGPGSRTGNSSSPAHQSNLNRASWRQRACVCMHAVWVVAAELTSNTPPGGPQLSALSFAKTPSCHLSAAREGQVRQLRGHPLGWWENSEMNIRVRCVARRADRQLRKPRTSRGLCSPTRTPHPCVHPQGRTPWRRWHYNKEPGSGNGRGTTARSQGGL